ncbi:hypothetical protein D3C81_545670 [compost metagenome]
MCIFKQLLFLFAVLLANSLSLEAASSGGLGQNSYASVLDSRQPQQSGHFQNFHRGPSHRVNRHFVHMGNRHFIPMGNPHFVPMHNQVFVPLHRANSVVVIRGHSFSDERFVVRHVHSVRLLDPRTVQIVIRKSAR